MKHPVQPIVLDEKGTPRFKGNKIVEWLFNTGKLNLNDVSVLVHQGKLPLEDYVQLTQLLGYSTSGWGDLSTSPEELVEYADSVAAMTMNGERDKYIEQAKGLCRDIEGTSLEIGGDELHVEIDDDARLSPAHDACWVEAWIRIPKEAL